MATDDLKEIEHEINEMIQNNPKMNKIDLEDRPRLPTEVYWDNRTNNRSSLGEISPDVGSNRINPKYSQNGALLNQTYITSTQGLTSPKIDAVFKQLT